MNLHALFFTALLLLIAGFLGELVLVVPELVHQPQVVPVVVDLMVV